MQTIALIGGIVAILGHLVWIRGILKGTMRLNLATWAVWATIDICVLVASISAAAPAPFLPWGFAVGASLIVLALLFKGSWKWGMLETVCSLVAVIALWRWSVDGPITALIILTFGKYTAGIPSIVRGYRAPERNQSWIWFLSTFSAATNIFAGGPWTIAQSLFPTVACVFSAITGFVHLRRIPELKTYNL